MRYFTIGVLAVLFALRGSFALAQFGIPQVLYHTDAAGIKHVEMADLDGDGLEDVVVASSDGKLGTYRNIGEGRFETQVLVATVGVGVQLMVPDIDNDGDTDIVVRVNTNSVFWFANDGAGSFGPAQTALSTAYSIGDVVFGDIDIDGDQDLLAGFNVDVEDRELWLFENDGAGDFLPGQLLLDSCVSISAIAMGDLDGDLDRDIVFGDDGELHYYTNDGSGAFALEQALPSAPDYLMDNEVIDYDGDGDLDILSLPADYYAAICNFYVNDGSGTFSTELVSDMISGGRTADVGDMDQDGLLDVLTAGVGYTSALHWHKNHGTYFSENVFMYGEYNGAVLSDVDLDGFLDIVYIANGHDAVQVALGSGGGAFEPFAAHGVVTASLAVPKGAWVADLDLDGLKDILVSSDQCGLSWLRNDGQAFQPFQRLLDTIAETYGISSVTGTIPFADLDGDGNKDLLSVTPQPDAGHITYYRPGDGQGSFGPPVVICTGCYGAVHLSVADLDNDGDLDFTGLGSAGSTGNNTYLWMENDGSGSFSERSFSTVAQEVGYGMAEDLDQDGDLDLVFANGAYVSWSENQGMGVFLPEVQLTTTSSVLACVVEDMDADGDKDLVLLTSPSGLRVYVNDGSQVFTLVDLVVLDDTPGPTPLIEDWDGDGDRDVLVTFPVLDVLQLFANDGTGQMELVDQLEISDVLTHAEAVDVDEDGDKDILMTFRGAGGVTVMESFIGSPFAIEGRVFADGDGDGVYDEGESPFPFALVETSPIATYPITNAEGAYSFVTDSGSYAVALADIPEFWQVSTDPPVHHPVLTAQEPISQGNDFGLYPAIDTTLIGAVFVHAPLRCTGGSAAHWVSVRNWGTSRPRVQVVLAFDPDMPFVLPLGSEQPDSIIGHTAYWTMDTLDWFAMRTVGALGGVPAEPGIFLDYHIDLNVLDAEGNILSSAAFDHHHEISCSFDPNDKSVAPEGYGTYGAVPMDQDRLEYTVRFQNTGTDTAYRVVIRDRLSALFELGSLEILGSSHAITDLVIEQDGELVITFDDILLPDSNVNEPLSHGFVRFGVRLVPGSVNGTEVANEAAIFFDVNQPVITNTTLTTLVDCDLFSMSISTLNDQLFASTAGQYQ